MDRIEKLKEFLKTDPNDAFLQHALAMEYVSRGDDQTARDLWQGILERDPTYIGSYYQLAKLLERNGEKESALSWYEKGMNAARSAGDKRTYNELQAAYEDLAD